MRTIVAYANINQPQVEEEESEEPGTAAEIESDKLDTDRVYDAIVIEAATFCCEKVSISRVKEILSDRLHGDEVMDIIEDFAMTGLWEVQGEWIELLLPLEELARDVPGVPLITAA